MTKRAYRLTGAQIREILERAGGRCQMCGVAGPLHVAALFDAHDAESNTASSYAALCPNCHARRDSFQPREAAFLAFLQALLRDSKEFDDIDVEAPLAAGSPYQADLAATRTVDGKRQRVLIEAKRYSFIRPREAEAAAEQLKAYETVAKHDAVALAFPGRVSRKSREILTKAGVEVWDIDYLADAFRQQISRSNHADFKALFSLFSAGHPQGPAGNLLAKLDACEPGRANWFEYQRFVRDAFEELFCPPLSLPLWEVSDSDGVNRRDIILPNHAESGFWAFIRQRHGADYIVVDPKNHKGRIKKPQVLQIANYLKPYGTGMFAIICSRVGGDRSALVTCREQWAVYGKMILILTDEDLRAMLLACGSGGRPEEVLDHAIQEFRLAT